jgi:hypothetical protein
MSSKHLSVLQLMRNPERIGAASPAQRRSVKLLLSPTNVECCTFGRQSVGPQPFRSASSASLRQRTATSRKISLAIRSRVASAIASACLAFRRKSSGVSTYGQQPSRLTMVASAPICTESRAGKKVALSGQRGRNGVQQFDDASNERKSRCKRSQDGTLCRNRFNARSTDGWRRINRNARSGTTRGSS